jgi:hypothetical protein
MGSLTPPMRPPTPKGRGPHLQNSELRVNRLCDTIAPTQNCHFLMPQDSNLQNNFCPGASTGASAMFELPYRI